MSIPTGLHDLLFKKQFDLLHLIIFFFTGASLALILVNLISLGVLDDSDFIPSFSPDLDILEARAKATCKSIGAEFVDYSYSKENGYSVECGGKLQEATK